jgi:ABC-type transport system involved in multi-copper enzyme maturation permease subunit
MTALTVPSRPKEDASLRPVPWRRMAWVTWRQHRVALAGTVGLLGAVGVYVWIAGLRLHHAYAAATACHPASSIVCTDLVRSFNGMNTYLAKGGVLQALPPLIGAFLGAPLLARELETGTFRYAWTQGFGRWRWTLAKLVLLAVVLTAAAGAVSVLFSWYYQPYFRPYFAGGQFSATTESSPFAAGLFDLRGVAFAAWTLAAFAIGGFVGAIVRRVVPAIAVTLATYAGLALATALYLRHHYLTPIVTSVLNVPGSAWVISQQWLAKGGQPVSRSVLGHVLEQGAPQLAGKGGVPQSLSTWQYLVQRGYTQLTTYQPASRFWSFQWIEGGWLVALSVLLVGVTVWLVRRRIA